MSSLLIVSSAPTHPTNAGNRARIRKLLEVCTELGIDYHIAFFRHESGDERAMAEAWGPERCSFLDYEWRGRSFTIPQRIWRRMRQALNKPDTIPYKIDDWRRESLCSEVRKLADRLNPTAVQVEYAFFSHLFECFDKSVYKILDTHDAVGGREKIFLQNGQKPDWFYTTEEQEAIALNRADCIISIQEEESGYFRKLTRKPVMSVGHMVEIEGPKHASTSQPTAIFIGSNNSVNQDAVRFLLEETWPMIRASVPAAALEIYGGVCASVPPGVPGVRLIGSVPNISEAYERAWLIVCPLRFGTGLKIKCIEALGQGKALVSTTSGCSGFLEGQGSAFLCADEPAEFARHCIKLLTDAKLRGRLEQGAAEFATKWNAKQRATLMEVFAAAGLLAKTEVQLTGKR